jgi:hypothetical protein
MFKLRTSMDLSCHPVQGVIVYLEDLEENPPKICMIWKFFAEGLLYIQFTGEEVVNESFENASHGKYKDTVAVRCVNFEILACPLNLCGAI